MRRWSLIIGFWILFVSWNSGFVVSSAVAIYDPLVVPNNRFGVHILHPSEVAEAAKLANSSGGDWGYVTIPLRSDDRDRDTWLKFFADCAKYHLIPIIRLATYPVGDTWARPNAYDLVDFANFLSEMPWPVKNRYVVLFNEPNHAKEWGGQTDPAHYVRLLADAKQIFKTRSGDFFLLTAGLDMSAPQNTTSVDALRFYKQMSTIEPDWLSFVDGLSVHTYPNPGFNSSVYSQTRYGPASYRHELNYLKSTLQLFITETGHLGQTDFYTPAFTQVWTETNIVAVTPFVLFAGAGEFTGFSLLDANLQPKKAYLDIQRLPKNPGSPLLSTRTPVQFPPPQPPTSSSSWIGWFKKINPFSPPRIKIGATSIPIEIADSDPKRQQGLSGRKSLRPDSGMLFVFPQSQRLVFWMKDMSFPLDFIWIDQGRVVDLTASVPPPSHTAGRPEIVAPSATASQVLEVNAGFIQKHGIKIGDEVDTSP